MKADNKNRTAFKTDVYGSRIQQAREKVRQLTQSLTSNAAMVDEFEKRPKNVLERFGITPQDFTLKAADGCYHCSTTTCSGRTCLKTC